MTFLRLLFLLLAAILGACAGLVGGTIGGYALIGWFGVSDADGERAMLSGLFFGLPALIAGFDLGIRLLVPTRRARLLRVVPEPLRAVGLGAVARAGALCLLLAACSAAAPEAVPLEGSPAVPGDAAILPPGEPLSEPKHESPAVPARNPETTFQGDIWDPDDMYLLEDFLLEHRDTPAVYLDLHLSDAQVEALTSRGEDRLWLDLTVEGTCDHDEVVRGTELSIVLGAPRGASSVAVRREPGLSRLQGWIEVSQVHTDGSVLRIIARPARERHGCDDPRAGGRGSM